MIYTINDHKLSVKLGYIFNKLISDNYSRFLKNDIEFEIDIIDGLLADGFCEYWLIPDEPTDCHYFKLEISSECQDLEKVLNHELIHCEQYLSGRLSYLNGDTFIFEGEPYDTTKIPYNELPWEIEAFAKE